MDKLSISLWIAYLKMKANTYVWMAWLTTATAAVILTYNPVYLTALLIILTLIAISRNIDAVRYLKTGIVFGLLPLAINVFFVHKGVNVIAIIPGKVKILSTTLPLPLISGAITLESTVFGFITMLILADMLLAFGIFSRMVNPDSLLGITPKIFFNSSLLTSIALRFTPVISDDMNSITDAQRSRGLNLKEGSLPQRLLKHKALIVPALVNTLERSFNLAESMASRAYTKNRTRYSKEEWRKGDYIKIIILSISFLTLLWFKAANILAYWPYDSLIPTVSMLPFISMPLLLSPLKDGNDH